MGKVRFGRGQLKNPTPANWSAAINVSTVILGAFITWMATQDIIPPHSSTVIVGIAGLLLTIGNGLKPFLGVQTEQTTIPKSDVTSMEVKP